MFFKHMSSCSIIGNEINEYSSIFDIHISDLPDKGQYTQSRMFLPSDNHHQCADGVQSCGGRGASICSCAYFTFAILSLLIFKLKETEIFTFICYGR